MLLNKIPITSWIAWILLISSMVFCVLTVGCQKADTPTGTYWIDTDNDGVGDVLVTSISKIDEDIVTSPTMSDTPDAVNIEQPIRTQIANPNDQPLPYYKEAVTVDAIGPTILTWIGRLWGLPALGAIALLWKNRKYAETAFEFITSIQAIRQAVRLQDNKHGTDNLAVIDIILEDNSKITAELVQHIKTKHNIKTVWK